MKKFNINTAVGICALLIGCCWLLEIVILPLLRSGIFVEKNDLMNYLLLLIVGPLMVLPGGLAVYFGLRLAKEKNKKNIKGCVGSLAFLGVFWLSAFLEPALPKHIGRMLSWLITTAAVIPVYIFASRFLMIQAGLVPELKGEMVGRGILLIISFQIWLVGSEICDAYAPIKKGYSHIKEEPWEAVSVIGPILLAWIFYKVAMRLVKKDKS
jgi:hypothetical protein